MSKKHIKFYSDPTHDPSFKALERQWYSRLRKEDFEDAEDSRYADRPLKRWTGVSSAFIYATSTTFPEPKYQQEEEFQHHPEFEELCIRICSHGNSRLNPKKIREIWIDYCDGRTTRQSEVRYRVSDTTIVRVIQTVTEWMKLMDTRIENPVGDESSTVILRPFNTETDTALIYASWRNALWYDQKRDDRMSSEFFSQATRQIKRILEKSDIEIRIACLKEDPDFIAGYSIIRDFCIEWIYVKIAFRHKGLARLLTKGFETVAEPTTKIGKSIVEKHELFIKENHGKEDKDSREV